MNKKGFLLLDALVIVVIISIISALCVNILTTYEKYNEVLNNYYQSSNEKMFQIFNEVNTCESCKIGNDWG